MFAPKVRACRVKMTLFMRAEAFSRGNQVYNMIGYRKNNFILNLIKFYLTREKTFVPEEMLLSLGIEDEDDIEVRCRRFNDFQQAPCDYVQGYLYEGYSALQYSISHPYLLSSLCSDSDSQLMLLICGFYFTVYSSL